MVSYKLKYTKNGQEIVRPIKTVESMSYNSPQSIVKKESLSGDGGLVVNTGRLIRTITLTGQLLQARLQTGTYVYIKESWNDVKDELEEIKERGYTITLETPLRNNDAGKYIIEDFTCDLEKGNASSLPFTIKLVEDRQANVKVTIVNLVSIGARESFIDRYRASLQGA